MVVPQNISSWDDWPNVGYLLSFPVGPDFKCEGGCGRMIAGSTRGNPVVRATKKTPGAVVCEDCLIAFARKFERPPVLGVHGALRRLRAKLARQAVIMDGLVRRNQGLRKQIVAGENYIERLEPFVDPRGKDRRGFV